MSALPSEPARTGVAHPESTCFRPWTAQPDGHPLAGGERVLRRARHDHRARFLRPSFTFDAVRTDTVPLHGPRPRTTARPPPACPTPPSASTSARSPSPPAAAEACGVGVGVARVGTGVGVTAHARAAASAERPAAAPARTDTASPADTRVSIEPPCQPGRASSVIVDPPRMSIPSSPVPRSSVDPAAAGDRPRPSAGTQRPHERHGLRPLRRCARPTRSTRAGDSTLVASPNHASRCASVSRTAARSARTTSPAHRHPPAPGPRRQQVRVDRPGQRLPSTHRPTRARGTRPSAPGSTSVNASPWST